MVGGTPPVPRLLCFLSCKTLRERSKSHFAKMHAVFYLHRSVTCELCVQLAIRICEYPCEWRPNLPTTVVYGEYGTANHLKVIP